MSNDNFYDADLDRQAQALAEDLEGIFQIPAELQEDTTTTRELIAANSVGKPLAALSDEPVEAVEPDFDEDVQVARESLRNVLNVGNNALNSLEKLALESEGPRCYEAISALVSNIASASKDLMEVHEKRNRIKQHSEEPAEPQAPGVVNNNAIFVGTMDDALEALREKRRTVIDDTSAEEIRPEDSGESQVL